MNGVPCPRQGCRIQSLDVANVGREQKFKNKELYIMFANVPFFMSKSREIVKIFKIKLKQN